MNFYPHHIGDYLTATAHLSWLEDCAYRRLLDIYYSREQCLPTEIAQACRLVRAASKDERKAVETVLREFFKETAEGWSHSRCDEEIVKARDAAERARANGKKGGRPKKDKPTDNPDKTQPVISGNPEESDSKAPNPNPITSYSEPIGSGGAAADKRPRTAAEQRKSDLWRAIKAFLVESGESQDLRAAGAIVTKAINRYDEAIALSAIEATLHARPAGAIAFLEAACQQASGHRLNKQEALEAGNLAAAERFAME